MDPDEARAQRSPGKALPRHGNEAPTGRERLQDAEDIDEFYERAIDAHRASADGRRSAEYLRQAAARLKAGDAEAAEELYRQALDAHRAELADAQALGRLYDETKSRRTNNPEWTDLVHGKSIEGSLASANYGLGVGIAQYASFLINQGREAEARRLLEELITPKTDHQLVWVQYQRVLLKLGDVDRLCWAIATETANKKGEYPRGTTAERIVEAARRAEKAGDAAVARLLVQRSLEIAGDESDTSGRWAALGLLGGLLEKAASTDEAIHIWRDAFAEGSTDAVTVERLAMLLEKRKERAAVIELIDAALERGFTASVENKLRMRRERCRALMVGEKPQEVAAFTERHGQGTFTCRFQTQVKPPLVHLHMHGSTIRCYCHSQGRGSIVDLDLLTGREVRRVDSLPGATYYHVSPDLWALGTRRTGPVGQGVTNLHFFRPDGTLARSTSVPDGTTEAAFGADTWYVGCRDGALYAFEPDGNLRWRWPVPGSEQVAEDPYQRPNPYFVAAGSDFVVCSNHEDLYALRRDGTPLRVVAGTNKGQVFVYDADGGAKEVRDFGLSHCFLPARHGDGSVAADASSRTTVSLFRDGVQTGSVETDTPPHGPAHARRLSRDVVRKERARRRSAWIARMGGRTHQADRSVGGCRRRHRVPRWSCDGVRQGEAYSRLTAARRWPTVGPGGDFSS